LARRGRAVPASQRNIVLSGLSQVGLHHARWLRPVEAWRPVSRNPTRQFEHLANHLFAFYSVPCSLKSAWFEADPAEAAIQQEWYVHLGAGGSMRAIGNLPFRMTKRALHLFASSPSHLKPLEALRWAQIGAIEPDLSRKIMYDLACNEYIRDREHADFWSTVVHFVVNNPMLERSYIGPIIGTPLGASFEHEPFWASVIQFLVRHPMLDPDLIGPIVDFIQAQKLEAQERALPGGGVERGDPPPPNFSMKSRSLPKLLCHVEEWHEQLARDTRVYTGRNWAPSGIGSLEWQDPEYDPPLRWTVHEILEGRELIVEGKRMNHCVASYANNCQRGNTSIWSMQVDYKQYLGRSRHVPA
jgi:hypothetical protein